MLGPHLSPTHSPGLLFIAHVKPFCPPICSQNNDGTLRLSCKLGIHPDVASGPSHGYECGDTNSTVNTSQNCGYPCTASVNAPLMGDLQFTGEEKVVDWKLFKSSKFNSTRCIIFQKKIGVYFVVMSLYLYVMGTFCQNMTVPSKIRRALKVVAIN